MSPAARLCNRCARPALKRDGWRHLCSRHARHVKELQLLARRALRFAKRALPPRSRFLVTVMLTDERSAQQGIAIGGAS